MNKQPPPRILIIKLSSLGDLFHALPTVHALRESLGAEVDWVTQPEYAELVRCFDDVADVLTFPRRNLRTQLRPFLKVLREKRYDYVIDLQGLMKSALVAAAARGQRKIGPSATREGARLLYGETAGKRNKERHAAKELLDVVRHLNLPVPDQLNFPVRFPEHTRPGNSPHIALCPCSRAAGKDWPEARFVQVAKQLAEETRATIHLMGGPADRAQCERMAAAIGNEAVSHAGQTTLIELGSLLQGMDLVLTVDSGPMHMAAAIGTPTLALFGPTSPLRTGPYGEQHRIIESTFQGGTKKISKKVREQDMRYIEAISVEEVAGAALEMIRAAVKQDSGHE